VILLALNVTKRGWEWKWKWGCPLSSACRSVTASSNNNNNNNENSSNNKQTNKQASDNSHSFPFIAAIIASFALLFHHARIRLRITNTNVEKCAGAAEAEANEEEAATVDKFALGTPPYDAPCDALSADTQETQQTQRPDQNPHKMAINSSARESPRA